MIITRDLVTNFNTYNMNSITTNNTTCTHEFNTYLVQLQYQHLPVTATPLVNEDITYLNDSIDIAETNLD